MNFVLILLFVLFCATIIFLTIITKEIINYFKNKQKIDNESSYKNIDVEKIDKIFNDIIEREFNDYQKFHPDISQEGSYIKREEIQEMITDITTKIYKNITPALRYNIGLIYDIGTEEKLINLIGEKTGILVMAFAAVVNSTLVDDTKVRLDI